MSLPTTPLPSADTVVTYPDGALVSAGTVVGVTALPDGRSAVLLDRTAFHALDPVWPDQPADRGTLTAGGASHPIVDAVVGATDGTQLYVGDAPVRTGTEGWTFVVCHLVSDGSGLEPGTPATVSVDADYRRALSAGHTACHLASLALNDALAGLWTKDVPGDGRGRPDFDKLAITSSRIVENGSVDEYRIGKSLRKKGFAAADLADRLQEVQDAVNADLADWLTTDAPVSIARDGEGLSERRYWRCELPEGTVEIACGGTHLTSLGELASVTVELTLTEGEGALELRMETRGRVR
ncbi:metal-dependent hydrolase [Leifsonia sp. F6_8S_P_1B]|uniref:Metal-dependent hydrolase n=1 Tax=Leifsonia williamsii TaxID=3035919 RepID=A0ABT8KBX2_9MICO|nr:metal-dependent hydrolase [Leifsonia williamsii]MDN4614959.1 metal-dependent hydrolase [Leifsonia williamsii]